MLPIQDLHISYKNDKWSAVCACGKKVSFAAKHSCIKMLDRQSCRYCKKDYRSIKTETSIYRRNDGKWCSQCSGCGIEQAYTRKDHAKQSELSDWQCKGCVAKARKFSENRPVGDAVRLYNKFRKSANARQIEWNIGISEFAACFTGTCALTGWEISMSYDQATASLDRIDSQKPYDIGNIQWVHVMVNMCKNKYCQNQFIDMCKSIANKKAMT